MKPEPETAPHQPTTAKRAVRRLPPAIPAVRCSDCGLRAVRIFLDGESSAGELPESLLSRDCKVAKGERLYAAGEPFHEVFAVKSGTFKSLVEADAKIDRVVGFHLPGELIGLESMAGKRYLHTVRALEPSTICRLRAEALPDLVVGAKSLQQMVVDVLSEQIAFQHMLAATLIRESALQRTAAFLLSLSERFEEHGLPGVEFTLTMSRTDIASFLGLAAETVTRMLGQLGDEGIIAVKYKRIRVLDRQRLLDLTHEHL